MGSYYKNEIEVPRFSEANGFYTTKKRSRMMSKVRNHDTKAEIKLRKFLWSIGIRYRKNVKLLPGTPDIVIAKHKLVIFVDGEFWHGHNWHRKIHELKSNRRFWIPKIERNMQRDHIVNNFYKRKGWTVFRFWEDEINRQFGVCIKTIIDFVEEKEMFP